MFVGRIWAIVDKQPMFLQKRATLLTFIWQATTECDLESRGDEILRLKRTFGQNGYSKTDIQWVMNPTPKSPLLWQKPTKEATMLYKHAFMHIYIHTYIHINTHLWNYIEDVIQQETWHYEAMWVKAKTRWTVQVLKVAYKKVTISNTHFLQATIL
jgi:hypothetical protein